MPDALTPAVLDALAEAEKKASPAPWRATYADHVDGWCIENDADHVVAEIGTLTDARGDAALIVLLRTHAPALIAAARRADEYREAMLHLATCGACANGPLCDWIQPVVEQARALAPSGEQGE